VITVYPGPARLGQRIASFVTLSLRWTVDRAGRWPFHAANVRLPRLQYENAIYHIDPKKARLKEWVYGGEDFLKQMLRMAAGEDAVKNRRRIEPSRRFIRYGQTGQAKRQDQQRYQQENRSDRKATWTETR